MAQVENYLIRNLVHKRYICSDLSWQTESAEHNSRVFQVELQKYLVGGRWSYPTHRSVRVRDKAPIVKVSGGNTPVRRHKAPSREMFNFWALLRLRSMYSVYGSLNLWCMHIFSDINILNHRWSLENRSCMLFWAFSYNLLCFVVCLLVSWLVFVLLDFFEQSQPIWFRALVCFSLLFYSCDYFDLPSLKLF